MLPRRSVTAALLVSLAALGSAAVAQADSATTPAITVTQAGYNADYSSPALLDPSAPVMIGDSVRIKEVVTNTGQSAAPFTLTMTLPPEGRNATWIGRGMDYNGNASCDNVIDTPVVCAGTLGPGGSAVFWLDEDAHAPGVLSVGASVTSGSDTATSTWQAQVDCQVMGTDGDDVLTAGPGQAACGLGGNDILIAQKGSIGLFGGAGNDVLRLGLNDPQTDAASLALGGDGIDTASFTNAPNAIVVCPSDAGGFSSGGRGTSELGDAEMGGIENIVGSRYDDYLKGNPGPNEIQGGGGNDEITGGAGHDIIDGNAGNDRFMGADRTRDSLSGGPGTDHADIDRSDLTSSTTTQTSPTFLGPCS